MATIRHTHSPGPLVSVILLLTFRPIRWAVYALILFGIGAWFWDSATETELRPEQYAFSARPNATMEPSRSMIFRDVRFDNRSDLLVQRIEVTYRIYDCPSDESDLADCSKMRSDKETLIKDIPPGQGADFKFHTATSEASGVLRVVPVVRRVVADSDVDATGDEGFVE